MLLQSRPGRSSNVVGIWLNGSSRFTIDAAGYFERLLFIVASPFRDYCHCYLQNIKLTTLEASSGGQLLSTSKKNRSNTRTIGLTILMKNCKLNTRNSGDNPYRCQCAVHITYYLILTRTKNHEPCQIFISAFFLSQVFLHVHWT